MIIVSLALLANRRRFRRILEEFSRSFALIVFLGLITLVLGLLVVVSHNVWSADWRVIITLLGWTALAKGVFRVLFPHKVSQLASKSMKPWWVVVGFVFTTALGAYLTYVGFSAQVG